MRAIIAGLALTMATGAMAADKVKVGFISTLSGPNASIGSDIRDGFNLAIKMNGGKLGGLPAEVLIGDDQLKPENAKQLLQHRHRHRARCDREQGVLHLAERRAGAVHRRAMQSVLLRRLLAERGV